MIGDRIDRLLSPRHLPKVIAAIAIAMAISMTAVAFSIVKVINAQRDVNVVRSVLPSACVTADGRPFTALTGRRRQEQRDKCRAAFERLVDASTATELDHLLDKLPRSVLLTKLAPLPRGPRGHTGAQGPSGSPGPRGRQGVPGPPGRTGRPGTPGRSGRTGRRGSAGSDGRRGSQGPTGLTGDLPPAAQEQIASLCRFLLHRLGLPNSRCPS